MPVGRPCKGPSGSPLRALACALAASLRAVAKSVAAIALTAGLTPSMRAIDASRSSTGEISFVPMRRRISTDVSSNSSLFDAMTYSSRSISAARKSWVSQARPNLPAVSVFSVGWVEFFTRPNASHENVGSRNARPNLLQPFHQALQQPRARLDGGVQHVLVIGMRPVAVDAKPVERRNAHGHGKIAVRAAARSRRADERKIDLFGDRRSFLKDELDTALTLERRARDLAGNRRLDTGPRGCQRLNLRLHLACACHLAEAQINLDAAFLRDRIAGRAASDQPDIGRDPARSILHGLDGKHQLHHGGDGAAALPRVAARARGAPPPGGGKRGRPPPRPRGPFAG